MPGASVRNRNREAVSSPTQGVQRRGAEGAVRGGTSRLRQRKGPGLGPGHLGEQGPQFSCLSSPGEGGTRLAAWESGEPFVGAHCSRKAARMLRGHVPSGAALPQGPPPPAARPHPSPPRPRPRPRPARSASPSSSSSSSHPSSPALPLPICGRRCAHACLARPRPARPGPARPPPPRRRTGPLAARPRARDWEQPSAAPARAPSGSRSRASRPPAPPHPPG